MASKEAQILDIWNEEHHLTWSSHKDQQKHFQQSQKREQENVLNLNLHRNPHRCGGAVDQLQTFSIFLILGKLRSLVVLMQFMKITDTSSTLPLFLSV